jgi:hypothetical protein
LIPALALTVTAAYAFKVGFHFSPRERLFGRVCNFGVGVLAFDRSVRSFPFRSSDQTSVALLTDEPSRGTIASAVKVMDVHGRLPSSSPDDPRFLDALSTQLHGFDRVVLSFSDPTLRNSWVEVMRRTGLQAEVLNPTSQASPRSEFRAPC